MGKETNKGKSRWNRIAKIYIFAHSALYVLCFILYYFGVCDYYGITLGVDRVLDIIFSISDIEMATYQNIMGIIISITYVVIFISLCVSEKEIIRYAKLAKDKEQTETERWKRLLYLNNAFGKGVRKILLFMAICWLVKGYSLSFFGILIIVVAVGMFLIPRLILYYLEDYTWGSIGIQMVYTLIFIASMGAVLLCLRESYVENIIMQIRVSFQLLTVNFRAFALSLKDVILSAIGIIIWINLLKCVKEMNEYSEFQEIEGTFSAQRFMYMVVAFVVVETITIMIAGDSISINALLVLGKKYFPLICSAIAIKTSIIAAEED